MSLDFTLYAVRETEVYWKNITHNLTKMASEAGLYDPLWRPIENGFDTAGKVIPALEKGLENLLSDPVRFKKLTPENGWGSYEGLVEFTKETLAACKDNPDAKIHSCV